MRKMQIKPNKTLIKLNKAFTQHKAKGGTIDSFYNLYSEHTGNKINKGNN